MNISFKAALAAGKAYGVQAMLGNCRNYPLHINIIRVIIT